MAIIVDPDQLADGSEITITTGTRQFTLTEVDALSADGVTQQCIYSFLKEEWKDDPNVKSLMAHPFPMVAITPEQFEYVKDWEPNNDATRKLIRTGGWREIDTDNGAKLKREFAGVISLGSFEDAATDLAYYQVGTDPTDTGAAINFTYAGPLNEAILTYEENVPADTVTGVAITGSNTITRNDGGNFITDGYKVGAQVTILGAEDAGNNGTWVLTGVTSGVLTVSGTPLTNNASDTTMRMARNYRNAVKLFLRVRDGDPFGKTFAQSQLTDIGVEAVDNKVFRFPLSNATDLKISETDANIGANSPYTQVFVRYFSGAFSQDVDLVGTTRDFGIVIDVGTHSGIDGVTSGSTLTTAEGGITGANYTGGTLTVHEGADKGIYTISGTPSATVVTITTTFPSGSSNNSFTLQRAAPIVATAEEIYEKVGYFLRQASDIDSTSGVVTGKTADNLLTFVGDTLKSGSSIPTNPNGGGSGVIIVGFDSNDTNRIISVDNTGTERSYPFVSAGTISFNTNLQSDPGPAKYFMYFEYTERFTNVGFDLSGASGSTATLTSSTTDLVAELTNGDYIRLNGFATQANNGIWQLTGVPSGTGPWTVALNKINGDTVVNEGAGPSVSLDKNPIDSDDAILVDNNSGVDITGVIGGASVGFNFDYTNNAQGGRTPNTDAAIVIRAIGTTTAQYVETTGTITQNTGLSYSLVAPLERNYSNPL